MCLCLGVCGCAYICLYECCYASWMAQSAPKSKNKESTNLETRCRSNGKDCINPKHFIADNIFIWGRKLCLCDGYHKLLHHELWISGSPLILPSEEVSGMMGLWCAEQRTGAAEGAPPRTPKNEWTERGEFIWPKVCWREWFICPLWREMGFEFACEWKTGQISCAVGQCYF